MQVGLAVLADYANLSIEGKINIMGIFGQIMATAVPTVHPQMQLVLVFQVDTAERGTTKAIQIKLLDEDGRQLASVGQTMQVPAEIPLGGAQIPLFAVLNGLTFPKYGDYAFHVLINEDAKARVPFKVLPIPQQPPVPNPPASQGE